MFNPHLAGWWFVVAMVAPGIALGQASKPFAVPGDRAEWEQRRPEVLQSVGFDPARDRTDPPTSARFERREAPPSAPGVIQERIIIGTNFVDGSGAVGLYTCPASASPAERVPLVVLLTRPRPTQPGVTPPGWDGRSPVGVLNQMGFAVLSIDDPRLGDPVGSRPSLRAALDATVRRPEVDPGRLAVFGLGETGTTALRFMAVDPRITCGVVAIEAADVAARTTTTPSARPALPPFEELSALCAPRPIHLMIGERLPLPPPAQSVGRRFERAAKGTYKAYGKESHLYFSLFGEFAGHESINTRLQWMAGLEWLDKHFRPQGPTPLGHAPEPEPTFSPDDKSVLNLTEHGIAGWSSEMSARNSTWSWHDGVVACRPQAHEYGWLRAPVEVSDYLLQVEWKVPRHGNAGIFMRAQPVTWLLPPTEENKLRVSTLGLTWPSRTGLELQTQDDPGHADRYSTGSLYRHAAPASNPTHSPDQWNRSTVRARGTRVEVWNNGEQVLDADLTRSSDTLPNPPLRGYIGLQNHGNAAEYRNVRLQRLAPEVGQGATNTSSAASPAGRTSR